MDGSEMKLSKMKQKPLVPRTEEMHHVKMKLTRKYIVPFVHC